MDRVERDVRSWFSRVIPHVKIGKIDHRQYDNGEVEMRVTLSFASWKALKKEVLHGGIEL